MTRDQILQRARAATANDPPQVVGYSEAELEKREAHRRTIERLRELRALWAREANDRPAVVPPAPRRASTEAERLTEAARSLKPAPSVGAEVRVSEALQWLLAPPAPEPDGDGPPTKRSGGCGLEPPPDTHRPFPLVRVRVPGVPHSRARATPAGSAPQPPTAPRRRAAELPVTTRRVRPAAPLQAWRRALRWAAGGGW